MVATVLGTYGYYLYYSENSNAYVIRQRSADAVAVGNTPTVRSAGPSMPRLLRPRHIWIQGPLGQRRRINVGDPANVKYLAGGTVNVDSISWQVTGRVGEKDIGSTLD